MTYSRALSYSRKFRYLPGYLLIALAAAAASFSGCSSDGTSNDELIIHDDGNADRPQNDHIKVDESSLRGEVVDGKLQVSFSVQSMTGNTESGALRVAMYDILADNDEGYVEVPYRVSGNEPVTLTASVAFPASIHEQIDDVNYVVRVADGAKNGLQIRRSLLHVLSPYDMSIEGPSSPKKGSSVAYRVRVEDPLTHKVLPNVPVTLHVSFPDTGVDSSLEAKTGPTGDAIFSVDVPSDGTMKVDASVNLRATSTKISRDSQATAPGNRVLLTTDKPIYQPGQTIHLRSLALSKGSKPVSGEEVVFEVSDGKGNKIFHKKGKTDEYGVASTDFKLGSVLNLGDFKVTVDVGGRKTEKTVKVYHYALPKFKVGVTTDKRWYRAGEKLHGSLKTDYFFGKSVAGGDVTIEAATMDVGQTVFQTVHGKTDAQGVFNFDVQLPPSLIGLPLERGNALVDLKITVTDTAGQQVEKHAMAIISDKGVDIALVPESTFLVPGVPNHLDLFLNDPMGAPLAGTAASILVSGQSFDVTTDKFGHADLTFTPSSDANQAAMITTSSADGKSVTSTVMLNAQQGQDHVIVRTDGSIYKVGDTVKVEIDTSDADGTVYIDWINAGQTVDMRTSKADDSGKVTFQMPIDTSLIGSNRVEAYVVDGDGNVIRSGRSIFVRKGGSLSVELATDKAQYEPGQTAQFTFSVKDEKGNPAVAALGVQVVDEAVYGLVESKPGLLQTYFELEGAYSKPSYEVHGPNANPADVLFADPSDPAERKANEAKARAMMAAMGRAAVDSFYVSTWATERMMINQKLTGAYARERRRLVSVLTSIVDNIKRQQPGYNSGSGGTSSWEDWDYVTEHLPKSVGLYDFWGTEYKLSRSEYARSILVKTAGPDEQFDNYDDYSFVLTSSDLGLDDYDYDGVSGGATGGSGGGEQGGPMADAGAAPPNGGGDGNESGPRVRKDFPETLYVNPEIITGADGKATISVPLADSITSWRVSSLANSLSGKLGGGVAGVTVFQDFFTDIDFPAELTRGDEVSFPIAVYNYLKTDQTVQLTVEPGDWYTPVGSTSLSVQLKPGEVKGVRFPVRVEKAGIHTLTVKAKGDEKSDAVARTVRVVPNGRPVPEAQSGTVSAAGETLHVQLPADAVPGSGQLYLNVFPAYSAQAVQGLDSILRTPTGCFEQTTSATWPNVLVLDYMNESGQTTPAIQMKAESFINSGYQRLLTYEHPNGGFSWFGTQDAAPNVSVTAFGLMEFSDMAKLHPLDDTLIPRTAQWLASQQRSDGSWEGGQTEFFSFNTSTLRNTAFVTWALSTAGYKGAELGKGLAYMKGHLADSTDTYTDALVANALVAVAPSDSITTQVLSDLDAKKVTADEMIHWDPGETEGNFYGRASDLTTTTTALAAHAFLRSGGYTSTIKGALAYLVSQKDTLGGYGSTQTTIWTLRALLLAQTKGTESAIGQLTVTLDGTPFATLDLTKEQSEVMQTVDMTSLFTSGSHDVALSFVGTGKPSFNLVSKHNVQWDQQPPPGPLSVSVSYDKTNLTVDETALATVQVVNNTQHDQDMVLVTLGLPPGFQVMTEDLQKYLSSSDSQLSKFEITGKQVILYLTKVPAGSTLSFSYRIQATMPIKAGDGGGNVFPYYQPSEKTALAPQQFVVTEK